VEVAKLEATREEVVKVVDWKDYYQTNKGRLLGIGAILTVVGLGLYFARGVETVLVLPIVGIVLLIAGVIYKPRQKKTENATSDAP
jgi:uncharacterized membrane protein HdeD (DUF308 family)